MRESSTPLLRCPRCHTDGSLRVASARHDGREIREGALSCTACAARFQIDHGIVDLLSDPPEFVLRESAGLARFAEVMRADGWDRERILELPDVDLPYWHGQRRAMESLLDRIPFEPGQRIVDIGSNTCWASNILAKRGLDVIALDIATTEMQGLRTADWFLDRGEVFFERLLSVMFAPALASASMDYVLCCEVLHHNDPAHLRATFQELHRILRPGGRLLVINEPMRFPLKPKRDHGREVAQFEGNEHVYFFHQYHLAARRAGFRVEIPALRGARLYDRCAYAWRHMLAGDTPLSMDCIKAA